MEKKYVYKATLGKVYGLTPSMIEELGEPDETCTNPHYRSGPPASLYLIGRVESWIERNVDRVVRARENRVRRAAAARAVRERERAGRFQKAEKRFRRVQITVQRPFAETLLLDAQSRYQFRGDPDPLTEKALHRYVRHHLTNYDSLLRELRVSGFCEALYPLLRRRVDAAVTTALREWLRGRSLTNKQAGLVLVEGGPSR